MKCLCLGLLSRSRSCSSSFPPSSVYSVIRATVTSSFSIHPSLLASVSPPTDDDGDEDNEHDDDEDCETTRNRYDPNIFRG